MSIPHGAPQIKGNATVIDIATRQAIVTTTAQRGGRRDPLPVFGIKVRKFNKHNGPTKTKKQWFKMERHASIDLAAMGLKLDAQGLFLALINSGDEGEFKKVTTGHMAKLFGSDYRQIERIISQLIEAGLIAVEGEYKAGKKQAQVKCESSADQVAIKCESSEFQVDPLEHPSRGAGLSPPNNSQSVSQEEITPLSPAVQQTSPGIVFILAGGDEWELPASEAASLKAEFPTVDADEEFRKAASWCRTNKTKRKTAAGMPKFLSSWFSRSLSQPKQQSLLPPSRQSAVDEATARIANNPRLQRFIKPKGGNHAGS